VKVLLDTNVILDALQERRPFDSKAKEILKRAQGENEFSCLFTANAASDIFYIYAKVRDMISAKTALNFLITKYGVVSVTQEDCVNALSLAIDDFEDALAIICAQKANAEYIVTRDEKFLQIIMPVKIITPIEFITILNKQAEKTANLKKI
jgi:predicted nucleic acid-binding protein